jgi:hypothetical protein
MEPFDPVVRLMAQLVGEVLAVVLGLWTIFGLGWREFGPLLVLFGAGGFVVTCVRLLEVAGYRRRRLRCRSVLAMSAARAATCSREVRAVATWPGTVMS